MLTSLAAPSPDPLAKHFPVNFTCKPAVVERISTTVPSFNLGDDAVKQPLWEKDEFVTEIYEWLSLIRLQSPRIDPSDDIDPYLSRYQLPQSRDGNPTNLCKVSWQGFFSSRWVRQILIDAATTVPSKSWFALSMTTMATSKTLAGEEDDVVVLVPPIEDNSNRSCYIWEVKSHE